MNRYAADLNKKNIFYKASDGSKEPKSADDVTFAKPKPPAQPVRQTISQIASDQQNATVMKQFIRFSIVMVSLPIVWVFASFYFLSEFWGYSPADSWLYAGLSSLPIVAVIMTIYVVQALREEAADPPEPAKETQKKKDQ